VELAEASSGVLVLVQDLLLAGKKLTWIDLTEQGAIKRGGYIFSTIITDRSPKASSAANQIRRSTLSRVLATGRLVNIEDVAENPQFKHVYKEKVPDIRSVFCIPIRKTEQIGMLYLDHPEPKHFTNELAENLTLLTEIASVSLHNMLNEGLDFMLSRATPRLISAEVRMERPRLIEMVLNEFKIRLGFSQVVLLKVLQDKKRAEIERAILEGGGEERSIFRLHIPLDPQDDLLTILLKDKKIASVEGIERKDDKTLTCHINGRLGSISNPGLSSLMSHFNYNPFLAIPLYLPNGVSGILIADKQGLPIVLGKTAENFMLSLSSSLSLALNWADEYQDMKKRLQRMYEERLRRESLTEVGAIIGEVSHVIASPIKHLITNLDSLSRKDISQEIKSSLSKMAGWSSRIKSYLFYVQDLARTEELEPVLTVNNIEECITNAWSERVAPFYPNIRIEKEEIDPNIGPFLFDSLQITSMFANLFMNAARAMEELGDCIKVSTRLEDSMIMVTIEDSGNGIPADILCDFFNIDRRIEYMSPEKGRGRGTLICKEIIKRHRGGIEILSTGGRFMTSYSETSGKKSAYFDEHTRRDHGTKIMISLPYDTRASVECEGN